jgi:hypothetical protein
MILKKINGFVRKWIFVAANVGAVTKFINDPKMSRTYYPEAARKSKARIWMELVRWLVKHNEVNSYYCCYGFDLKKGPNQKEYLSLGKFKVLRNSRNNIASFGAYRTDYTCLLKDKFAFYLLLSSLGFPTPKVLGVCIGNRIDWLESRTTEGIDSLANRSGLNAFCKTLLGECTEGTFPLRVEGNRIILDGAPVTLEELASHLKGGFIIQELIEQHPRMAELHEPSINTLRITTVRKGSDVTLFSTGQRIGTNGFSRDNWATGGLFGPVDEKTGRLGREFKFQPGFGGIATRHPQTGVTFEGFEIPHFHDAVRMAIELHTFLYGINSIGWDIAIAKDGPLFIEGNDNWEIAAYQAVKGGLRAKLLDTLGAGGGVSC